MRPSYRLGVKIEVMEFRRFRPEHFAPTGSGVVLFMRMREPTDTGLIDLVNNIQKEHSRENTWLPLTSSWPGDWSSVTAARLCRPAWTLPGLPLADWPSGHNPGLLEIYGLWTTGCYTDMALPRSSLYGIMRDKGQRRGHKSCPVSVQRSHNTLLRTISTCFRLRCHMILIEFDLHIHSALQTKWPISSSSFHRYNG